MRSFPATLLSPWGAPRVALGLAFVCVCANLLSAQPPVSDDERLIYICPIKGEINDGVTVLVERAVREAHNAKALIFVINTPGGRLDSALNITDVILKASCTTVAYLEGMGGISAGALISYSCDEIIMSSTTNIGASAPIMMSPDGGVMPASEKEISFLRSKYAALGEAKGHNPALGMAMVNKELGLVAYPKEDGGYDIRVAEGLVPIRDESGIERVIDAIQKITDLPLEPLKEIAPEIIKEATGRPEEPNATEEQNAVPTESTSTLRDGGIIILRPGKLLTLTSSEAMKYGLIPFVAENVDAVVEQLGYKEVGRTYVEMTWSEQLFGLLTSPTISGLLFMAGLLGLYYEIKTPGFGLPGIVGITCLTLFFGARAVIGLSNWLDIALVITGVTLLLIEAFVLPGFGLAGVGGIVCLLLGLYLSFSFDNFIIPEFSWEWARLNDAGYVATVALAGMVLTVLLLWKVFPHTPLYGKLVLADEQRTGLGFTVQRNEEQSLVGAEGVASSLLVPTGRARFGEKTYQVVSRGEYIEAGTPIVIVEVQGNRYVVDRLTQN